jgi:methylmalonyl-CoA mutase
MANDRLLQDFPPVSTQAWEDAIARDLRGADYAKKLIWQSDEGLALKPYYRAEDLHGLHYPDAAPGDFPYARGTRSAGGWHIREEIDASDPEEANRAACRAVAAGAEEIAFSSVAVDYDSDLGMLLANLEDIPVHLEHAGEMGVRLLIARLAKRQVLSRVSTGFDPLENLDFAAEAARTATPALVPFTIHGEEFEESGATAVEEVGFTLAAAVDFLAGMQSRNIEMDRAAASIQFSFAIGANFFFQTAKFRAFRMLWANVVESFGGARESARALIHARTSRWNETIYDPHVNVLRGTTEALSAALGGVDSLTVAPFDECYKSPDEASRRLARNTQILLKQEAFLSRVADPGAGSYCLEVMTDFLAREGWKCMQKIEAAGGFLAARADGQIERALEPSLAARESEVATRRRVFTGTNNFANRSEKALDRIDESRMLRHRRATESYEHLRLRTERHAARTGKSPRVLLAEFGDVKMRSARSNFAVNFFACAGLDIVSQQLNSPDEIAAADAELIVLCSSDAEYLAWTTELMSKLQMLGRKTPVLIAGNPDSAQRLRAAGIADFVHLRTNPVEFLTAWQRRLGIEE